MDLDEVLAGADAVSLHVPLLPETRHMINARSLALMKPDAVLINAARGGVVDEAALANALRSQKLAGAALDVFEIEPLGAEAAQMFDGLSNLVLTPHIAGVTQDSVSSGRSIRREAASGSAACTLWRFRGQSAPGRTKRPCR